jgi:hypothetical protein
MDGWRERREIGAVRIWHLVRVAEWDTPGNVPGLAFVEMIRLHQHQCRTVKVSIQDKTGADSAVGRILERRVGRCEDRQYANISLDF